MGWKAHATSEITLKARCSREAKRYPSGGGFGLGALRAPRFLDAGGEFALEGKRGDADGEP